MQQHHGFANLEGIQETLSPLPFSDTLGTFQGAEDIPRAPL